MENSHENIFIGNLILENGLGNYTMDLIDDGNGTFKLNGTNLLVSAININKFLFLSSHRYYQYIDMFWASFCA